MAKISKTRGHGRYKHKDRIGEKHGRLTILSLSFRENKGPYKVRVLCDCGAEKTMLWGNVFSGNSTSCGCFHNEDLVKRFTKHGGAAGKRHRLYQVWKGMRARCNSKSHPKFRYWGGRGIRVCRRWDNFANFLADMEKTFREGLWIERKNNNGNYTPKNCKWATPAEQAKNKRSREECRHILLQTQRKTPFQN